MKREPMTENYIFRFFRCGLSVKKTCELCDVSQKTVEGWDKGKTIPKHHRKLMELYSGAELGHLHEEWNGWKVRGKWIITPYGERLTPDQLTWLAIGENKQELRNRRKYWQK